MPVRQCYPAASNLDGVACNSHVSRSGLAIAGGGAGVGWRAVEPRMARQYKVPGKGLGYALGLATLLFGAGSGLSARAGELTAEGCHAQWSETELVIGNTNIERRWSIQGGLLRATSFRDLNSGTEWIESPAGRGEQRPAGERAKGTNSVSIRAHAGQFSPVGARTLVVELTAGGRRTVHYQFQICSAAYGVSVCCDANGSTQGSNALAENRATEAPTGEEKALSSSSQPGSGEVAEELLLAPEHLRFIQVTFADQTDRHNELVSEREWLLMQNEQPILARGNLFICENVLTGAGLIFLKQAPLPESRPVKSDWDVQVEARLRRIRLADQGYPLVTLAYTGGRNGRTEVLQSYQRQMRAYSPGRDGLFLSNTWGDRSRDARINESFMLREIEGGARLGVDVIQIDDGWQAGHSANSAAGKGVWQGFWAADPHFWDVDRRRFPAGVKPLVASARAKGMKFGLWYAPDSSRDFANWQRDAERILELWRTEGIEYFKLDSINVTSVPAQDNLRHLFSRILEGSQGKIVIDLDVTAGVRPGYFGAMEVGPIFVENRYTDFHRYWPHQTLRNLWLLSQYVDPLRLRMEFLNNARNAQLYPNDPLAPAAYSPDCLFATIMFANPLGWFETSNVSPEFAQSVAKLVRLWKQERSELYSENILPIGQVPDGVSWTGFLAVGQERRTGYLLAFRELNQSPKWSVDLSPFREAPCRVSVLAGDGSARVGDGKVEVQIPKALNYLWLRIEKNDNK